jgi:serine/threonine protein kinase
MSPEQAEGRLDLLGPASDVYSLGATLYCLLTGRAPFADPDTAVMLQKVQRGDFPKPGAWNSWAPPALEAICLKAMARKQENRYSSPRALADDIEHWLADEPVSAWPEPVTVRAGRWMRRHKPLVSGAAAALLVGLIALTGGTIWYQGHQAEAARKLALTEQAVRQGLDQARETGNKLHADTSRNPAGFKSCSTSPPAGKCRSKRPGPTGSGRRPWRPMQKKVSIRI